MVIKARTLVITCITCITQSWVPIAPYIFVNGEGMVWIASFSLDVIPFVFSWNLTIINAQLLIIPNVIHNMWNLLCNIFSMGQGLQLTITFTPIHDVPQNHQFHPKKFSTTSQNVGIYIELALFFGNIEWNLIMSSIFAKMFAHSFGIYQNIIQERNIFPFSLLHTLCIHHNMSSFRGELLPNSHGPLKAPSFSCVFKMKYSLLNMVNWDGKFVEDKVTN